MTADSSASSFIPGPLKRAEARHRAAVRVYQGIPGVAVTEKGRLFAVWYGGGKGEGPENYVMIALSDDGGRTWGPEEWVVDPPAKDVRAFDPALFVAPEGTLWCFWTQCRSAGLEDIFDGRSGVWCSRCENPDDPPEKFRWSFPVRICNGIMLNPPAVLSDGTWALPVSVWHARKGLEPAEEPGSKVYVSEDSGRTFAYRGMARIPAESATYDEHSIYEPGDGTLTMLIRKSRGFWESRSTDGGRTWSEVTESSVPGPGSRGYVLRLASGRLLALTNDCKDARRNLTAFLSSDGGRSWPDKLRLDLRDRTSYPAAVQDKAGFICIVHDHDRYGEGEILFSKITEADIEAGVLLTAESFVGVPVSALPRSR